MSLDGFLSMKGPLFGAYAWLRLISIASFTLESLDINELQRCSIIDTPSQMRALFFPFFFFS